MRIALYDKVVSQLTEIYRLVLKGEIRSINRDDYYTKQIEVLLRLSITGTSEVMDAFGRFVEFVDRIAMENKEFEEPQLRRLLSEVTYAICCDIHGEQRRVRRATEKQPA